MFKLLVRKQRIRDDASMIAPSGILQEKGWVYVFRCFYRYGRNPVSSGEFRFHIFWRKMGSAVSHYLFWITLNLWSIQRQKNSCERQRKFLPDVIFAKSSHQTKWRRLTKYCPGSGLCVPLILVMCIPDNNANGPQHSECCGPERVNARQAGDEYGQQIHLLPSKSAPPLWLRDSVVRRVVPAL